VTPWVVSWLLLLVACLPMGGYIICELALQPNYGHAITLFLILGGSAVLSAVEVIGFAIFLGFSKRKRFAAILLAIAVVSMVELTWGWLAARDGL